MWKSGFNKYPFTTYFYLHLLLHVKVNISLIFFSVDVFINEHFYSLKQNIEKEGNLN